MEKGCRLLSATGVLCGGAGVARDIFRFTNQTLNAGAAKHNPKAPTAIRTPPPPYGVKPPGGRGVRG